MYTHTTANQSIPLQVVVLLHSVHGANTASSKPAAALALPESSGWVPGTRVDERCHRTPSKGLCWVCVRNIKHVRACIEERVLLHLGTRLSRKVRRFVLSWERSAASTSANVHGRFFNHVCLFVVDGPSYNPDWGHWDSTSIFFNGGRRAFPSWCGFVTVDEERQEASDHNDASNNAANDAADRGVSVGFVDFVFGECWPVSSNADNVS